MLRKRNRSEFGGEQVRTLPDCDVFWAEMGAGGGVQVQRSIAGSAVKADDAAPTLQAPHTMPVKQIFCSHPSNVHWAENVIWA